MPTPSTLAADAPVCARCAAAGPTCCHARPDEIAYCFPLSDSEERRIRAFDPDLVCPEEANSLAFLDCMTSLFPDMRGRIPKIFPNGEGHKRLPVTSDGYCVYLGPRGCVLPREIRPWYCLVFPFWVQNDAIIAMRSPDCLARKKIFGLKALMEAFGVTPEYVRHNCARLREAWGLDAPAKAAPISDTQQPPAEA